MLSAREVKALLGPVDEELVLEILATGATAREVAEAMAWAQNDEALINEGRALPDGRVGLLIRILEPPPDDEGPLIPH